MTTLIPDTLGSVLSVSDEVDLVVSYRYAPVEPAQEVHVMQFEAKAAPTTPEDRWRVLVAIARAHRANFPDILGEPLVSYETAETNEAFFYQYGLQAIADQDESLG